jgi:hypothetical protein
MNSALEGSGTYHTGTAQNKDAGAMYNPGIGNDDDNDQSVGGGGHNAQKIKKTYGEPAKIQKQYGEPARKKNPALEESGNVSGTAQNKDAGAILFGGDDDDDQPSGVVGQKIQKQYGEPAKKKPLAQNKDAGAILNPGIVDDNDNDQSIVVGYHAQKIQKQYGEPAKKKPALEKSGIVPGQYSDADLSATDEIDLEDEDSDDPDDPLTKVEKTKYDNDVPDYLTTLRSATQKSLQQLNASEKATFWRSPYRCLSSSYFHAGHNASHFIFMKTRFIACQ